MSDPFHDRTQFLKKPNQHGRATAILDRREWERYAVAVDQAWLGWWEGRIYRKVPAALVDVSQGGVKLLAEFGPPRRSTVWVCLAGQHRTQWVEGTLLSADRTSTGHVEIRLAFREICPYAFFDIAVNGYPALPGSND